MNISKLFTTKLTPEEYIKTVLQKKELNIYNMLKKYSHSKDYEVIRLTNLNEMYNYSRTGFEPEKNWHGHNAGFRELYLLKNKKTGKYTILNINTGEPKFENMWVDNIAIISWFGGSGLTWGEDATFGILFKQGTQFAALYSDSEQMTVKNLDTLNLLGKFTYTKFRKYYYSPFRREKEYIYQKFANYNESWVEAEKITMIDDKHSYVYDINRSSEFGLDKLKGPYEPFLILEKTPYGYSEVGSVKTRKQLMMRIKNEQFEGYE